MTGKRQTRGRAAAPAPRLKDLEGWRRMLGLRFYRRFTLLRGPLRVAVHVSRHPSLSLGVGWVTLNLNQQGGRVRVAPATGLAYQRRLWRWPPSRRPAEGGGDDE